MDDTLLNEVWNTIPTMQRLEIMELVKNPVIRKWLQNVINFEDNLEQLREMEAEKEQVEANDCVETGENR